MRTRGSAGVWLVLLAAIGALMVGPETAGASWGHRAPYCSKGEGHHCYAISSASINAWASIGLQDTHFSTVYDCASGGFVSNEMWVEPESKDEGWLEVGQIVGYGYCDQVPHLFYAELSPTNRNVFHIMVSTAAVPSQSYNWYAISDIPEHNGRWHIYYSSPPGYTGWNNWAEYGGGWGTTAKHEQAGMEAATESHPSYEGSMETAYTNTSIVPFEGWVNWNGAEYFAEASGNTCIVPLGNGPGNANVAAC